MVPGAGIALVVAAGNAHTCVRDFDGSVHCWGHNGFGQLGDGTTIDRARPTLVSGVNGVTGISASIAPVRGASPTGSHTCAVNQGGRVYCWGSNEFGQLGDESTTSRPGPVDVRSGESFSAVAVGGFHSCAIAGTRLFCWGNNAVGQLGDGTTTQRTIPALVTGLPPVRAVACGLRHTCAVDTSAQAWCWGDNAAGQLGDGTRVSRSTPARIVY